MTLAVNLALGLAAGLIGAVVTMRWPAVDPGEPTLRQAFVSHQVAAHPGLRPMLRRRVDPHSVMGALLAVMFVGVLAMTTVFGLVAIMVRTNSGVARFDKGAAEWGARHATELATEGLRTVSLLGGTHWGIAIVALVGFLEVRRTRRWTVLAFLILTVVGQNLIVNTTKVLVGRARPSIDQLTGAYGYSFPSGHSAQAAAMFAAVALVVGRGRGRAAHALLAGAAIGATVSVAASRVLLGVHWVTDVVAGVAVGWGWFALVSVAFGGRWLHFGAPVEMAQVSAAMTTGDST